MKRLYFGLVALLMLLVSSSALAECYPAASGPSNTPGCAQVDSYVNSNGKSQPNGTAATYFAQVSDAAPVATATDLVTICGSATKIVRITHVEITADATGASVLDLYTLVRTTANTGAASSVTAAQADTNDPVPTAAVSLYHANPSVLGTGTVIAANHYSLPAAATTGYPSMPWVIDFGTRNTKAVVLRGTAQCYVINLNGQTIPSGASIYVGIQWIEE